MKDPIIAVFNFNAAYARRLVEDIPEDKQADQPADIPNHPAWVIGHLANTADFGLENLGRDRNMPAGWAEKYGNASTPVADRSQYPAMSELLDHLDRNYAVLIEAFRATDDATLAAATPVERVRTFFPLTGNLITFILTSHASMHLGQVSSWRRAAGLGSVF